MVAFVEKSSLPEARSFDTWKAGLAIVAGFSLLLLCASIVQDLALYVGPHPDLSAKVWLLDVDVERSAFTWISVLSLFAAAGLLFIAADEASSRRDPFKWHWYFLALLFLLLSFDEFCGIHEKVSSALGSRMDNSGLLYFAWAAPAGILSLVGLVAYLPFIRSLPPRIGVLFLLSAALFLSGAVILEMFGGSVAEVEGVESVRYRILTNMEEGLELAGTLAFIYGLLRYREGHFRSRHTF